MRSLLSHFMMQCCRMENWLLRYGLLPQFSNKFIKKIPNVLTTLWKECIRWADGALRWWPTNSRGSTNQRLIAASFSMETMSALSYLWTIAFGQTLILYQLFQVWDSDIMDRDDFIGEAVIPLATFDFHLTPVHTAWYTLRSEVRSQLVIQTNSNG